MTEPNRTEKPGEWVPVERVYWARCIMCNGTGRALVWNNHCLLCDGTGKVYVAYGSDGKLIQVQQ